MGLPQPKQHYTPDEYLRRERDALDKHEYYRGEIFAMAGGSPGHSLLIANTIWALRNALDAGRRCRVYDSNLRVRIPRTTLYTYPDASVVCGELEFDPLDRERQTVLNPTLIVEVLSPSTEGYDRGTKFENYQQIESLRQYVLLSQDAARAESFLRQPDGAWLYAAVAGTGATVRLAPLAVDVRLADLYSGVALPPAHTGVQTEGEAPVLNPGKPLPLIGSPPA